MKHFRAGGKSIAVLVCTASCLLTAWEETARAQGNRARTADRRIERMREQGEQYERDELRRDHKGETDDPHERRRAQALTEQVKHDFAGLQEGYNKIVLAMSSKERVNYDAILDAVAEVRKCAARLRENLALPRTKNDEGQKSASKMDGENVDESLLALRKHVYNFVTNPLFEAPSVLDVEQAGKAGRDLDMILELSETIRKNGDRLKKLHD